MQSQEPVGLLAALFDFSFTNFITTKLIKFIFGLGLVLGALAGLGALATLMSQGFGMLLLGLIVVPICYLLVAMYLRVMMEVMIVLFRIAENTERMADNTTRG